MLKTLSAMLLLAVPVPILAADAGCAFVRIEAPANQDSCASGSFSKKGKPVYAVNADTSHEITGVVIRHHGSGVQSNDIGPFDLGKGATAMHLVGCNQPAIEFTCVKATVK